MKYLKNYILNLTKDNKGHIYISHKISQENPEAQIFIINELTEIKGIDSNFHLDIIAHGNGSDFFYDKSTLKNPMSEIKSFHYQELAKNIADQLNHLKMSSARFDPNKPMLSINLTVCFTAMPRQSSILQSIAAKFQFELAKNGIFAKVYASQSTVSVNKFGIKKSGLPELNSKILKYYHSYLETEDTKQQELYKNKIKKITEKPQFYQKGKKVTFQWEKDKAGKLFQSARDSFYSEYERATYEEISLCEKMNNINDMNMKNPLFFAFDKNKKIDYAIDEKREVFLKKLDKLIKKYEKNLKNESQKFFSGYSSIIPILNQEKSYLINLHRAVTDKKDIPVYKSDKFHDLYQQALEINRNTEKLYVEKGLSPIIYKNYF